MPVEIPRNNPERKEKLDDNARKFTTESLDSELLGDSDASSFTLTID